MDIIIRSNSYEQQNCGKSGRGVRIRVEEGGSPELALLFLSSNNPAQRTKPEQQQHQSTSAGLLACAKFRIRRY